MTSEAASSGTDSSDKFLRHIVSGPFWGKKPSHIGVAVSGGSDSMAMLDLLAHWTKEAAIELSVVSVDHGLRVEAKDEAAFVAKYCAARGLAHQIVTWDGWDGTGNLQAMARDARYQLLADWARAIQVDRVAIGHTSNDQAETFLMRLARSSGVDGLAAMQRSFWRNGVQFTRPVLGQTRQELRDYLQRHDIDWIDDPSNSDRRFDRVKAREAMEHLEPLGITERTIRQTTHHMSMAASTLAYYTAQEAKLHVTEDRGDLILTAGPELPVEIARRLTIAALRAIGGEDYPPRSSALAELDYGLMTAGKHTLAGCVITKEDDATRYTRELNAVADTVGHTELFWDRRWRLDGPHAPDLSVKALGEQGLALCKAWRGTGLPRMSLLASPSIWRGDELISAPLAGLTNDWRATPTKFGQFLLSKSR